MNKRRPGRARWNGCAPIYPWDFVRTNTIFGVIHGAGGYTARSDKHPSYSAVSGPGNRTNGTITILPRSIPPWWVASANKRERERNAHSEQCNEVHKAHNRA